MAITCVVLLQNSSSPNDAAVKAGGIFPIFGKGLPNTNKNMKKIDKMCQSYCKKNSQKQDEPQKKRKFRFRKNSRTKLIDCQAELEKQPEGLLKTDLLDLICFNPTNDKKIEKFYHLSVNNRLKN